MASVSSDSSGNEALHAVPTLRSLAKALREGTMTSETLVRQAISRREAVAPMLDAYTHFAPGIALSMARAADEAFARGEMHGRLQGIPVSIKDLFAVEGMPTFAGSRRSSALRPPP